jgi:hypothetical protein
MAAVQDQFSWAFVLVPAFALVLAVVGFTVARKPLPEKAFGELKAQLDADAKALRAIGARS